MTPGRIARLAALAFFLVAADASACPVCQTETGDQVRAAVFGPDFAFHLLVAVLPLAAVLGLARLVETLLFTAAGRHASTHQQENSTREV